VVDFFKSILLATNVGHPCTGTPVFEEGSIFQTIIKIGNINKNAFLKTIVNFKHIPD